MGFKAMYRRCEAVLAVSHRPPQGVVLIARKKRLGQVPKPLQGHARVSWLSLGASTGTRSCTKATSRSKAAMFEHTLDTRKSIFLSITVKSRQALVIGLAYKRM